MMGDGLQFFTWGADKNACYSRAEDYFFPG